MASRECSVCGHETDAASPTCDFCGAPQLRKSMLARAGIETAAKWGLLLLVAIGIWQCAVQWA